MTGNSTLQAHRETPQVYPTTTHTDRETPQVYPTTTHTPGGRAALCQLGKLTRARSLSSPLGGERFSLPAKWVSFASPALRLAASVRSLHTLQGGVSIHFPAAPTQTGCEVRSNNTRYAPTARLGCRPWLARFAFSVGQCCSLLQFRLGVLLFFFFSFLSGGGAQRGVVTLQASLSGTSLQSRQPVLGV